MAEKLLTFLQAVILTLCCVGMLTGCNDEKSKQESSRYQQLIQNIDEIDFQISQEMILKASSPRDKESIRGLLRELKNGFIRLSRNPADQLGYSLIERAIKTLRYDHIQILEKDRATLTPLIQNALDMAYATAQDVGADFQVDWAIYSFRFSRPITEEGFISFPQGAWKEDWALDRSYVATNQNSVVSWLIAPAMDLTKVAHPKFRIVHTININSNDRREKSFDRQAFLRQSFKAKVSLDYLGGDPSPEACNCTWEDVDLGPLPSSKDFHTTESPEIDLSRFRGKNVSIALFFDVTGLGSHYVNWNVSLFEVSGAGSREESQGRVTKTHLAYSFGKKELAPFQVITQTPESLQWQTGGRGNGYDWVVAQNSDFRNNIPFSRTSSLLISPRYVIGGVSDPIFSLEEKINHNGSLDLSELKILISSDYTGGSVLDATWHPIERSEDLQIPKGSWDSLFLQGISLKNLTQPKFTLLFWYDSKSPKNKTIWELIGFALEGKGGTLSTEPFHKPPSIPALVTPGGERIAE